MPSMETLLYAMQYSLVQYGNYRTLHYLDPYYPKAEAMKEKRWRQFTTFRERILRMDAELRWELESETNWANEYIHQAGQFFKQARKLLGEAKMMDKQLVAKDAENQRLRGLLAEIEWSSYAMYAITVQYGVCPSCKAPRKDGHFEGCRLAKELSDDTP